MNNSIIKIFLAITIFGIMGIVYLQYEDKKFYNNDLEKRIYDRIYFKEIEIRKLIKKHYGIDFKVPIIISKELGTKRFGMAVFNPINNDIKIYLSKSRFKESENYMINDVLPHEYAHALMFKLGKFSNENGGHTKAWQNACINLNGLRCDRFVNHDDILIDKMGFFK